MLDINLYAFLVSQSILHGLVGNLCILKVTAFSDVLLPFGRALCKHGN